MKIAMIGLGDIAKKAYLPVLCTRPDIEIHLCTRNREVLRQVGDMYRVPCERRHDNVLELLDQGLDAAFVHTATDAHVYMVEQLLERNVDVYLDKPIDNYYENSEKLVDLAYRRRCVFMVGFNRRYAPLVRDLTTRAKPEIIVMQKHRSQSPGPVRQVIMDDFIHVVDTLRFLIPGEIDAFQVRHRVDAGQLLHVVVQLSSQSCTAIGMMNRVNGMSEEILEVMGSGSKWKITDLRETIHYISGEEHRTKVGEWTSVGTVRGFQGIVEAFLEAIRHARETGRIERATDALLTHELCERMIRQIEL
ncbi:Gfo/Idh/MocA family protein [Alicyclobacillus dauci]|uniref:Gfo/Idh/MocA family oxidoreductase n=1 Tax=Alicyclobacillus dauci TaxID=1475485 RepID=A0ABY6Z8K8_9BACL|nr:Gfo/Idh/MocA family oxidoreductase [Alicyclobacillus dauci]WAH38902.1 Gfo/Idh/MocA family oxidoreductase [Alicyclobacillus dauci]